MLKKKKTVIRKTTEIAVVDNKVLCDKLRNTVANLGVRVRYDASQISDCKMRYTITTDQHLSVEKRKQVFYHVAGFIACFHSY